eukprot:g9688.t1
MQNVVDCWLDKLFAGTIDTLPLHVDRLIDRLLYQQIIEGSVNWHAPQLSPTMSASPSASPGSHKAPQNWNEVKTALLDCLMPANSVEESALPLATFSMDRAESVASFALRFQSEVARYLSCVQRMSGGNPFDALTVDLSLNGLVPDIKLLASQERPPKTTQEAVSQARRLEASNLTGLNPGRAYAHASAMSVTHVPNRSAIAQQYESIPLRDVSGRVTGDFDAGESESRAGSSGNTGPGSGLGAPANAASEPRQGNGGVRSGNGGGRSGNGGGRSGNGGRGGAHANRANRTPGPRPRCTYSRCRKPLGHTYETCYQRQREEGDGGSGGGGSGGHRGNGDNKRAKRNNSGNNSNSN